MTKRKSGALAGAVLAALSAAAVRGQPAENTTTVTVSPPTTAPGNYVTRQEYERLRAELDDVKGRVDTTAPARTTRTEVTRDAGTRSDGVGGLFSSDRFLVTGYGFAGFSDRQTQKNTFSAGVNPIFLWRITDRIFVEAEIGLELSSGEEGEAAGTETSLEYGNINFIVNDYLTLRAGLFLTPFGQFPERLHPAWINKLPDFPVVYNEETGLVPFSSLGIEARGAVPLQEHGLHKLVYAAYVANGPALSEQAENAGSLDTDNFNDVNAGKSVGGRMGLLPIPELEVGASIQYGDVGHHAELFLLGVDASYTKEIDAIRGTLDARAEWIWSDADTVTFEGELPGTDLRYHNKRSGGYVQVAYRPTLLDDSVLRNFEAVVRYDNLRVPGSAPGVVSDQRLTFGLDYWVTSHVVLKAAYQLDDPHHGEHDNAFLLQVGVGF